MTKESEELALKALRWAVATCMECCGCIGYAKPEDNDVEDLIDYMASLGHET